MSCGSCTLCCTLLGVEELRKPADTRCQHECSRGCGIYETRPASCRMFECVWLQSQTGKVRMHRSLRPDKSRVVLWAADNRKHLVARVDPRFPGSWRLPDMWGLLSRTSNRVRIALSCGDEHWEIWKGEARQMIVGEPDESGFRKMVGYTTDESGEPVTYRLHG